MKTSLLMSRVGAMLIALSSAESLSQNASSAAQFQEGQFEVTEDRTNAKSRTITLRYLRLPSTTSKAGNPIVFLTGGPGSPAIPLVRGSYLPIFNALREAADVIILDQRGTGRSNSIPVCPPTIASDVAMTRSAFIERYRAELPRCWKLWNDQGVSIAGYNTVENAKDLEDLRRHLQVDKIDLFGISYGTHLAQAAIKLYPNSFGRVALAGIEGLDQTVKRPAHVDAVFARVDKLLDEDREARAAYPDLPALMRRVHAKLNEKPIKAKLNLITGGVGEVTIDGFGIQLVAGNFIRSASSLVNLPAFYLQLDAGDYSSIPLVLPRGAGYPPISGMAEMMDLASGISQSRVKLVEQEAKTTVLGDALNFPAYHLRDTPGIRDLGDEFRAPMRTEIPALLIAGDLDGRTPIEEQREAGAQFKRATWIVVENAGHDVVLSTPGITPRLVQFFKGEHLADLEAIRNAPPNFTLPSKTAQ